jgi:hypothetical protein
LKYFPSDDRVGSKTEVGPLGHDVCFFPRIGHCRPDRLCPPSARGPHVSFDARYARARYKRFSPKLSRVVPNNKTGAVRVDHKRFQRYELIRRCDCWPVLVLLAAAINMAGREGGLMFDRLRKLGAQRVLNRFERLWVRRSADKGRSPRTT